MLFPYFYNMATSTDSLHRMLSKHEIRRTSSRMDILEEFARHGHALSQPDLEKALGAQYDRVTIYRTLTLYVDRGILHQVLDDAGAMKYALCQDSCEEDDHHHDHVHFKCNACGQTVCIADAHIPRIALPDGYRLQEQNLLMTGTCAICNGN